MLGVIFTVANVIKGVHDGWLKAKPFVEALRAGTGPTVTASDTNSVALTPDAVEAALVKALGTLEDVGRDTARRIEERNDD